MDRGVPRGRGTGGSWLGGGEGGGAEVKILNLRQSEIGTCISYVIFFSSDEGYFNHRLGFLAKEGGRLAWQHLLVLQCRHVQEEDRDTYLHSRRQVPVVWESDPESNRDTFHSRHQLSTRTLQKSVLKAVS